MSIKSALKNLISKVGGTPSSKTISGLINEYADAQGGGGSGGTPELISLGTISGGFSIITNSRRPYYGGLTFSDGETLKDVIGEKRILKCFAVYETENLYYESDPVTIITTPDSFTSGQIDILNHQDNESLMESITELIIWATFPNLNSDIIPDGSASCELYAICN